MASSSDVRATQPHGWPVTQVLRRGIENAKKAMIHDHISHSLERSFKASGSKGQAALRDFKLIAKYL
jgi:uncharacterized protein